MPKGAHFKKENPRIYQVSFKVNKTELERLQEVVKKANLSVPEWIRQQVTSGKTTARKTQKTKPSLDTGVHKGQQISMF